MYIVRISLALYVSKLTGWLNADLSLLLCPAFIIYNYIFSITQCDVLYELFYVSFSFLFYLVTEQLFESPIIDGVVYPSNHDYDIDMQCCLLNLAKCGFV